MTKPIVQLHTIDQWMAADKNTRSLVLQNIKLKDKLYKFLKDRLMTKGGTGHALDWTPCHRCETKGWLPSEPRLPGVHPSAVAHPCLLKIYNEMTGVEAQQKIDAKLQLIFDLGHAVHDMLQSYGKQGAWGPVYDDEVRLSKELQDLSEELMLEGHADAENIMTIDHPDSPVIYEVGLVHEYKTINTNGFEKLTRPKPEHKMQAMIYSAALNRPVVVYLYFNKNDSSLADFPVAFELDLWVNIEGKIRLLKHHFDTKTPPPAATGYHCQQCAYMHSCEAYAKTMKK